MPRFRAAIAGVAVMLVSTLAAGCSTSGDDAAASSTTGGSGAVASGPKTGLTATTMKVAVMIPDFGALVGSGLVPDLGDVRAEVEAYVEHLNARGGIANRRIIASYHTFDPADFSGRTAQAACIAATEEQKAFAVIGMPAWQALGTTCVAGEHRTPIVTQTEVTPTLLRQAGGRVFSLTMDLTRMSRGWVGILDDMGELDGKRIGIITGNDNTAGLEAVNDGLGPELRRRGHEVRAKVVLPCAQVSCEQHEAAVERFRRRGVDYVFDALSAVASPTFIQAADRAGYHPRYTFSNTLIVDTVAQFHKNVASVIDGMVGVGDYAPPNPGDPPEEDAFSKACNEIYARYAKRPRYPVNSDAAGMTAAGCTMLDILKRGAENVDDLGQASLVAGIERIGTLPDRMPKNSPCRPLVRPGSFGPGKHDASNYLNTMVFDAASVQFLRPDPCRFHRIPDRPES
jgi:hypothetical protein